VCSARGTEKNAPFFIQEARAAVIDQSRARDAPNGKEAVQCSMLLKITHSHLRSTLCGHLLWRFAIQQQSTAPQSGHALLTQVTSMCS